MIHVFNWHNPQNVPTDAPDRDSPYDRDSTFSSDFGVMQSLATDPASNLAFFSPDSYVKNFEPISRGPNSCEISRFALDSVGQTLMGYGMSKRLALSTRHEINSAIARLRETGILQRMNDKFRPDFRRCEGTTNKGFFGVSIRFLLPAYKILASGYGMGIAAGITELSLSAFYSRLRSERKKKKTES